MIRKDIFLGQTLMAGEREITPVAGVFRVRLPGMRWGVVWGKPQAVIIKTPGERYHILKIPDRTRRFQIYLMVISLLSPAVIWLTLRRRRNILKME